MKSKSSAMIFCERYFRRSWQNGI